MKLPKRHLMLNKGEQFDITFIHKDNKEYSFSAGINSLNDKWMWWYSSSVRMYAGNKTDVKQIVKDIRKKTTVNIDTFEWIKKEN